MSFNWHPLDHVQELSLRYGDLAERPGFHSEQEREAAWFAHRDRLLMHCNGGQRPAGWWEFESPIPYPGRDYAQAALYEAELLTEREISELMSRWRRDFERAQDPRFTYCVGFAKPSDMAASWLEGAPARHALYCWSGIPRDLLKRWTRERRRRDKTIRKLETAEHPAA